MLIGCELSAYEWVAPVQGDCVFSSALLCRTVLECTSSFGSTCAGCQQPWVQLCWHFGVWHLWLQPWAVSAPDEPACWHACLCRSVHTYMFIPIYIMLLLWFCAYLHTHTHARTHARTHAHTHTQTHARTHITYLAPSQNRSGENCICTVATLGNTSCP